MNPFGNVSTPPENIGGKSLKPGDIVYHWQQPEILFQIIGEPEFGKHGGKLVILDWLAVCEPLTPIEGVTTVKYSCFDLVKAETTPEQDLVASEKALARAEKGFKKGMLLHQEGCDRPCQYSPEQIGWDCSEAMKRVKVGYLEKAREDFGY